MSLHWQRSANWGGAGSHGGLVGWMFFLGCGRLRLDGVLVGRKLWPKCAKWSTNIAPLQHWRTFQRSDPVGLYLDLDHPERVLKMGNPKGCCPIWPSRLNSMNNTPFRKMNSEEPCFWKMDGLEEDPASFFGMFFFEGWNVELQERFFGKFFPRSN